MQEVAHGELAVMACAVIPNVPDKQGIYGARIILEILSQVENGVVIESHRHAHVMERRRVALQVLYGVSVGVEDERAGDNLP